MNFEPKNCKLCGKEFNKRHRDSRKQWESREYCSMLCNNRSRPKTPIEERFWRFVTPLKEVRCWEWMGNKDGGGYGTLSIGPGLSPAKAHRLSWEMHYCKIPDGLSVCHACDNPGCVNPSHLMLGSTTANALDMARKGRMKQESFLNLRPGEKGITGAGTKSMKEIKNGIS